MTENYPCYFSWSMTYDLLDELISSRLTMLRNMNDGEYFYASRSEFSGMDYIDTKELLNIINRYVINTELTEINDTYLNMYKDITPYNTGLQSDTMMYAYSILPILLDAAKQDYYKQIEQMVPIETSDVVFVEFKFNIRKMYVLVKIV